MSKQNTDEQLDLDQIEARAAHLYEYPAHAVDVEILAGTEVPALLAEVRRLRDRNTELEVGLNDLAHLVSHWYNRAEEAKARIAELEAEVKRLSAQVSRMSSLYTTDSTKPYHKGWNDAVAQVKQARDMDDATISDALNSLGLGGAS